MRHITIRFILTAAIATITSAGQGRISQREILEVRVPRDVVRPLIAYQPDCPLKLDYLQVNNRTEGGTPSPIIRFRNVSGKTIRAYKIAFLIPGGAGGAWASDNEKILPGELIPEKHKPKTDNVIQLTDNLKKSLKLEGPMQAVWVFMVTRVMYEDNSVFEDEKTYRALEGYFEKIRP
jgi:hypothetical protein